MIDEKPFELKQLDNNLNIVINYSETLRASKYQNFLHKLAFEKFGSVLPLLIINMHFLRFEHAGHIRSGHCHSGTPIWRLRSTQPQLHLKSGFWFWFCDSFGLVTPLCDLDLDYDIHGETLMKPK